jgi:hypothetical protein
MTLAYRASTAQGDSSGAGLTVTKPAGTVDGDIIIVNAYLELSSNTWSSVGSGFTLLKTNTVSGEFTETIWWKRASSEPASWTWTPTSNNWRTVTVASYSGNTGSGNAIDVVSGASGSGTAEASQLAPTVTTTAANDMLIFLYSCFGGTHPSSLSGACTNLRSSFAQQAIGDSIIATASATGTTHPVGVGAQDWGASHVALLLADAGGATSDIPVPLNGLGLRSNTLVRM